jgi:hypothetical protein
MQTTRIGEVLENPVTGERAVIRVTPLPSNGYALVADLYVRPGGAVTGEHIPSRPHRNLHRDQRPTRHPH